MKKIEPLRKQENHCIFDDITPNLEHDTYVSLIVLTTVFSMA